MHILILNWRDPKSPLEGGAERFTQKYAEFWASQGNRVTWLTNSFFDTYNVRCKNSETKNGVEYRRIGPILDGSLARYFLFYPIYLLHSMAFARSYIKKESVDLVIDEIHGLPFFTPLISSKRNVLLVCEVAGSIWDKMFPFPFNIIGKNLEKFVYGFYKNTEIWAISKTTQNNIVELLPKKNVAVINLGIDVNKEVLVGDSAKAIISNLSLIGGKAITLKLGNPAKPLPEKSMLISEVEQGLTDKLGERFNPMVSDLEITVKHINNLLSEKNTQSISAVLQNLEKTSVMLNSIMDVNGKTIYSTTSNLQKLTGSLVETEKELKPLLSKANTLADSLNRMKLVSTIDKTNTAMAELNLMLSALNKGEGTAGKLLHDDSLYTNLNSTARDLDKLMIDLKANPKRYVHFSLFGGKKDK